MWKRGNIVWVDFGQPFGSEQGGVRPALIVQNDVGNRYSPTIIVLPITKSDTKKKIPTQTEIYIDKTWSLVYGEQIRTIDKKRVRLKQGVIEVIDDMSSINKALMISMGLTGGVY